MREKLESRLNILKKEFETGTKQLSGYEAKTTELRNTLLRISGAIQVLEEELAATNQGTQNNINEEIKKSKVEKIASSTKT